MNDAFKLPKADLSGIWNFINIWVDDVREPPPGWVWVASSKSAIAWLKVWKEKGAILDKMSLDHDLGGDDTTRPLIIWMIENDYWPQEVVVHSSNPVGREWLEGMIERYKP